MDNIHHYYSGIRFGKSSTDQANVSKTYTLNNPPPPDFSKLFNELFGSVDKVKSPSTLPPAKILFVTPVWLGDVRAGGFHDLIKNVSTSPYIQRVVNECLSRFTRGHDGTNFSIPCCGEGPDYSSSVNIESIFRNIYTSAVTDSDRSEWATPIRMSFFVDKEYFKYKSRLIYGGHFYATGDAEAESDNTTKITKILMKSIYWADYRSKSPPLKIL